MDATVLFLMALVLSLLLAERRLPVTWTERLVSVSMGTLGLVGIFMSMHVGVIYAQSPSSGTAPPSSTTTQPIRGLQVPCLKRNRQGKWEIQRNSKCIMYGEPYWRDKIYGAIKTVEAFRKKYQPMCELTERKYKLLDQSYDRSMKRWELRFKFFDSRLKYQQQETKVWRDQFVKLQQLKIPPPSWTRSPALWFAVGVGATIAVGAAVAGIIVAVQPARQVISTP